MSPQKPPRPHEPTRAEPFDHEGDTLVRPPHADERSSQGRGPVGGPPRAQGVGPPVTRFDINAPTAAQPLPAFSEDGASGDEVELDLEPLELDFSDAPVTDPTGTPSTRRAESGAPALDDPFHAASTEVNLASDEVLLAASEAPKPVARPPSPRNVGGARHAPVSGEDDDEEETLQLRRPSQEAMRVAVPPKRSSIDDDEIAEAATMRIPIAPDSRPPVKRTEPKITPPEVASPKSRSQVAITTMVSLNEVGSLSSDRKTATLVLNPAPEEEAWDGDTLAGTESALFVEGDSDFEMPAIARWQVEASRLGDPVAKRPQKAIALDEPIKHKVQTVLWAVAPTDDDADLDDTPSGGIDPRIHAREAPPAFPAPPSTAAERGDPSTEDIDLAQNYVEDALNFIETLRTYGAFMDLEARRGYEAAIAGCGQKLRRALAMLRNAQPAVDATDPQG